MFFLHPTLLAEKYFPILQHGIAPQGLSVLLLKLGFLVLSLPELVRGELQLYHRCSVVKLAHHLVLVFPMVEVQWKLRGWTVFPAALLEVQP
jgi:hypothetical protein